MNYLINCWIVIIESYILHTFFNFSGINFSIISIK